MTSAAHYSRPKSIVPPEQLENVHREDIALRLLEAAYELRTCYDAFSGIEANMAYDRASNYGLQSIIGRHMNVIADIALEIDPEIASAPNDRVCAQD